MFYFDSFTVPISGSRFAGTSHTVPQKPMGVLIETIALYIFEADNFPTKHEMERQNNL